MCVRLYHIWYHSVTGNDLPGSFIAYGYQNNITMFCLFVVPQQGTLLHPQTQRHSMNQSEDQDACHSFFPPFSLKISAGLEVRNVLSSLPCAMMVGIGCQLDRV